MRIWLLGLLCVVFLGALDCLTGYEISFSIFYLLPVAVVAWYAGRRAGILISCVAAASWLLAEILAGSSYSHPAIPLWNTLVRLGFFLIVTYILSTLRVAGQNQESLIQFVVHDLRSPLSVILTGLQTLQEISAEATEEDRQRLVRNGIIAGGRMLSLINSLLDLSRLESGRMPIRIEDVKVRDLVRWSLEEVEPWAEHKRLSLVVQSNTEFEMVRADPDLTMRVLVNLLGNAIKFSPPESAITVRVAAVRDGMLAFSVSDQGPGIPAEWRERVFDKFVRVEARTKGVTAGSGLGLHFCQQAVKAQGGQIWLENEPIEGTNIHFTLPTAGCCAAEQNQETLGIRPSVPPGKLSDLWSERPCRYTRFGKES
jgi:signal transduction histidine kinase